MEDIEALVADMDAFSRRRRAKRPKSEELDGLHDEIERLGPAVADCVRLARACYTYHVPIVNWFDGGKDGLRPDGGYLVADAVTHRIGIVRDKKNNRVIGIGILGEPAIVVAEDGRVAVTKSDEFARYGASKKAFPETDAPQSAQLMMCRRFVRELGPFEAAFERYVRDYVDAN